MAAYNRRSSLLKSPLKHCRDCQQHLPRTLEYFHSDKSRGDGLQYRFKVCQNAACKVTHQKYHERISLRNQNYHAKNRERLNARQREKDAANPEAARVRRQKNYQKHHTKRLAGFKVYRQTHVEQIREAVSRRRAIKASAPVNDFSAAQWIEMQAAYNHCCAYCGKRCKGRLTQDHITPLSKGGAHTASNIIPACRTCNSKKGTKAPPIPVQPLLLMLAPSRKKVA